VEECKIYKGRKHAAAAAVVRNRKYVLLPFVSQAKTETNYVMLLLLLLVSVYNSHSPRHALVEMVL